MSVGFLGTLMARLTAARAARLDNLDTTVSSRASGSYYTSNRATKLDNLDTTISSRASASALATTDAVCDAIRSKTDSYLNATISSRASSAEVGAINAVKSQAVEFTSSGSWSVPSGVEFADILICGGGGGGGKSNSVGGGGGGGEVCYSRVRVTSTLTVTLGAGGIATAIGTASTVTGGTVNIRACGGLGGGITSVASGGGASSGASSPGGPGGEEGSPNVDGGQCPGFAPGGSGTPYGAGGGGSIGPGGAGAPNANTVALAGTRGGGGGGGYYSSGGVGGTGYCQITWLSE